ncbi:hypothetical protein M0R36_11010 [bacterium]|jgi:hypothetical protein|nr:hypothetical protein [bacterium]
MGQQLHVGNVRGIKVDNNAAWHSRDYPDGKITYWCGSWGERTPKELLKECQSIIIDLLIQHPDLLDDL